MFESILDMHLPSTAYLDAHDLAGILKVSPATILRRAKKQPHTLPAPAHLGPNFPLRWRRGDVAAWLAEGVSSPGCSSYLDDAPAPCD